MPQWKKQKAKPKTAWRKQPKLTVQINKVLNQKVETKKFPTEVTESSISSAVTCVVDEVSEVAVGTNDTDRIGSKIHPTGFYWNYLLHNNSAVPVYVRMVAFLADGGKFSANTDSFRLSGSSLNPSVLAAENLRDCTAMLNKHEMKILYDKTHRIAGLGDATGVETVHRVIFKKLSGIRQFDVGDDPDSKQNNLRIMLICRSADNDTVASVVEATYNCIYYYKDF